MLAAAKAFCDKAKAEWLRARQASEQAGVAGSNAPGNATLLAQVMPPWMQGRPGSVQQLGGLSSNVWLWRSASIAESSSSTPAASHMSGTAPEVSHSSTDTPDTMVFKFLEADGGREALARRSWTVQKAWGLAGCAPQVVSHWISRIVCSGLIEG